MVEVVGIAQRGEEIPGIGLEGMIESVQMIERDKPTCAAQERWPN